MVTTPTSMVVTALRYEQEGDVGGERMSLVVK